VKRLLSAFFVLAITTGCKTDRSHLPAEPLASQPASRPAVSPVEQHAAALALAAWYYCAHQAWPQGVSDLQAFQDARKIPLRYAPDWAWLQGPAVTYARGASYLLRSRTFEASEGWITISSGQDPPVCRPGETTVQGGFVNIDSDDQKASDHGAPRLP
jgi:hypothetical protein